MIEEKENNNDFILFCEKYAPPQEIITLIEKNKKFIPDGFLGDSFFGKVKELPEIYFKGSDINRIINAYRMKQIIEKHSLTYSVSQKNIFTKLMVTGWYLLKKLMLLHQKMNYWILKLFSSSVHSLKKLDLSIGLII